MMNNFEKINTVILNYLSKNKIKLNIISSLHETSKNTAEKMTNYIYNGKDIKVIDMDTIAREGYKLIIKPQNKDENPVNTVDAFLINDKNEWYFIEFKDCEIKSKNTSLKDNIVKKAYCNWYMLLDIIYEMKDTPSKYDKFDFENPIKFAKEHVFYILVCSAKKNPGIYSRVKNMQLSKNTYTPPFMCRLKDYLFKDAYVYTDDFLEREFVNKFIY